MMDCTIWTPRRIKDRSKRRFSGFAKRRTTIMKHSKKIQAREELMSGAVGCQSSHSGRNLGGYFSGKRDVATARQVQEDSRELIRIAAEDPHASAPVLTGLMQRFWRHAAGGNFPAAHAVARSLGDVFGGMPVTAADRAGLVACRVPGRRGTSLLGERAFRRGGELRELDLQSLLEGVSFSQQGLMSGVVLESLWVAALRLGAWSGDAAACAELRTFAQAAVVACAAVDQIAMGGDKGPVVDECADSEAAADVAERLGRVLALELSNVLRGHLTREDRDRGGVGVTWLRRTSAPLAGAWPAETVAELQAQGPDFAVAGA